MNKGNDRPTRPLDPIVRIAKVTVELNDGAELAEFFEYVAHLLRLKKKVTIFVQSE